MKTHFISFGQSACGTFNPKSKSEDFRAVTCGRCLASIEAAAKTGVMVNEKYRSHQ